MITTEGYSAPKRTKQMPSAAPWMDLYVILSGVRQRQKPYAITIWEPKQNGTNDPTYKTNRATDENKLRVTGE